MTKLVWIFGFVLIGACFVGLGWVQTGIREAAYELGSRETRITMDREITDLQDASRTFCDRENRREYGRGFRNGMRFKEYMRFNTSPPVPESIVLSEYIKWSYEAKRWVSEWDLIGHAVSRIIEANKEKEDGGE